MLAVGERLLCGVDARLLRVASVFAGGVGGTREEMCGALSASVMIIGALRGRSRLEQDEQEARRLAKEYRERFQSEFGETQCALVREQFLAADGSSACGPVVERTAAMLLETLGLPTT